MKKQIKFHLNYSFSVTQGQGILELFGSCPKQHGIHYINNLKEALVTMI